MEIVVLCPQKVVLMSLKIVLMSVKSCTFDTNSRKISSVVLMHIYRVEKIEVVLLIVIMKIVVLMTQIQEKIVALYLCTYIGAKVQRY